ncbi:polysaccharide biosynthesis protein [Sphaerochaeta globosa str. Buddy]|uniref:Polysaccharide biosynthesis protein n=2 Tax=Sphaerochaeta TaxID=399320 RepID=F0RU23_SPHGB|nr:polysaccharide biosynthesis protein [Sphaerochaeta globosa str. Buddy]
MNNSRKKNAILNILIGYIAQIGLLFLSLVGRKIFLSFLSIEYLGINGLYSNILSVLSLAELGLDSAAVYSLYEPVASGNTELTFSLIKYFKKIYYSVSAGIFVIGLLLIPFLSYVINTDLPSNDLILYYVLFLSNTVASYFVAHKVALLSASQEQRVQKISSLISSFLLQILHIIVLLIWKNYYLYIIATVINTFLYNFILSRLCDRIHPELKKHQTGIDFETKPITSRIRHTLMYKLGVVAINNTDNILISSLVSTAAVGLYSNYYVVISAVQGFISVVTTSMISGIGNLAVSGNRRRQLEIFNMLLMFYHFLAALGGIGFGLLFNNLITLWLGNEYLFNSNTVSIISFNFYISCIVNPVWMYREANGLFKDVKYLIIVRAMFNITFSVLLGYKFGTFGILLATAVSLLITSFWFEPRILFRKVFNCSEKYFWIKQFKYSILSVISLVVCNYVVYIIKDTALGLILKAIVIVIVTSSIFSVGLCKSSEFRGILEMIKKK